MDNRTWYVLPVVALAAAALVGCGGEQATPVDEGDSETYASEVLDTSYEGALSVSNQLALGTMKLEEADEQHPMENAVTPEQAAALLPLWQALRGGVTAEAEVNAVLKQIEGTMTQEQLEAIAAMQLTQKDLWAWMQEQGLGMGGGSSKPGGDVSEEEREALQATKQAGGGFSKAGGDMSEEEREALRATKQAGGGIPGGGPGGPGGRGGAGGRQLMFLLNPLIELLEARAGEA